MRQPNTMHGAKGGAVQIAETLQLAISLHQRGELAHAKVLYESILKAQPRHFDALHLLGVIAAQTNNPRVAASMIEKALAVDVRNASAHAAFSNLGAALADLGDFRAALTAFNRSIAIRPDVAEAHCRRGNVLRSLKQWDAALASFDRAIAIDAHFAVAHLNRGLVLQELGQIEAAIESFLAAAASRKNYAEAYCSMGNALRAAKRWDAALASYQRALAIKPGYFEVYCNCGVMFSELNQWDDAVKSFNCAIALKADCAEAYSNRGNVQIELKQWSAALESYDRALAIRPDFAEAHSNRAIALKALRQWDAALGSLDRAISMQPRYASAYSNRGDVLHELQRFDAALANYDRAIAISPDYAEAHANKAVCLLLTGDFANGWPEYEWRWKSKRGSNVRERREFRQPVWDGAESLEGKTILLHCEQGLGDTIQFCRYAKLVAELNAVVILEVQAPLAALLANLEGVSELIVRGNPLPNFDCQCALLSLPLAFGTHLGSIPSAVRYLGSETSKRAHWEGRLEWARKPRIGIVWSGSALHKDDHNRSIALADLLEHLPGGFQYVSLQKEVRAADQLALRSSPGVAEFSGELNDFSDTAALCDCLDLVITVDTSVAHLSAALGRRTWILLPFNPDWRWLLNRFDSPWYPSVQLYRQSQIGDWAPVLSRVSADLMQMFGHLAFFS